MTTAPWSAVVTLEDEQLVLDLDAPDESEDASSDYSPLEAFRAYLASLPSLRDYDPADAPVPF